MTQVKREASKLEELLECSRVVQLSDDIWFWDRAAGFICEESTGGFIRAFVYQAQGSGHASGVESMPVANGEAVITTNHVTIIGPKDALMRISKDDNQYPEPRASVRKDKAVPLTQQQEDSTFCVRAVSSHALLKAGGEEESVADIARLDSLYPGYAKRVAEVDQEVDDVISPPNSRPDDLELEGVLSSLGPATKVLCT